MGFMVLLDCCYTTLLNRVILENDSRLLSFISRSSDTDGLVARSKPVYIFDNPGMRLLNYQSFSRIAE